MKHEKLLTGGLPALARELKNPQWKGARYTILVDENTFQHCLPMLIADVESLQEAAFIELPEGEDAKCIEVAAQVWQTLLEGSSDREAVVVNLGGGSLSDLGGFVAAGYKRGIRYINVPTTLLAMVDASIGGKTAIDLGGVKNSIGHFYSPVLTVIEPAFLATLSAEQLLCGQMEMVKTAAVCDPELYTQLMSTDSISPSMLKHTARLKSRVVKADPYDSNIRRILNFGHTFGHAIEQYSHLPHGLAVGVGMEVAMYLSAKKVGLGEATYATYREWLRARVEVPHYGLKDIEQMLPLMHHDKKCAEGELRCVLLRALGEAIIDVPVSNHEVRDALLRL